MMLIHIVEYRDTLYRNLKEFFKNIILMLYSVLKGKCLYYYSRRMINSSNNIISLDLLVDLLNIYIRFYKAVFKSKRTYYGNICITKP